MHRGVAFIIDKPIRIEVNRRIWSLRRVLLSLGDHEIVKKLISIPSMKAFVLRESGLLSLALAVTCRLLGHIIAIIFKERC